MTTNIVKTPSAEGKKDVQKLQRAIVDGLEDVKAQNIQVFDTEHITSLFERVIVASGSSNRQTKALAASVRDAVRDAGFAKPRIEGEDNGEWIIVDCGAAVAHIMQPTIRQYYNLEELWGDKPIKLKLGAPAPVVKEIKPTQAVSVKTAPAKKRVVVGKAVVGKKTAVKRLPESSGELVKKEPRTDDGTYVGRVGKTNDWTARRNASPPAAEPEARPARAPRSARSIDSSVAGVKPSAKKAMSKSAVVVVPVAKKVAAKKVAAKKIAVKEAAKPAIKKPAARKTAQQGK